VAVAADLHQAADPEAVAAADLHPADHDLEADNFKIILKTLLSCLR
jgi:hypothetical protein